MTNTRLPQTWMTTCLLIVTFCKLGHAQSVERDVGASSVYEKWADLLYHFECDDETKLETCKLEHGLYIPPGVDEKTLVELTKQLLAKRPEVDSYLLGEVRAGRVPGQLKKYIGLIGSRWVEMERLIVDAFVQQPSLNRGDVLEAFVGDASSKKWLVELSNGSPTNNTHRVAVRQLLRLALDEAPCDPLLVKNALLYDPYIVQGCEPKTIVTAVLKEIDNAKTFSHKEALAKLLGMIWTKAAPFKEKMLRKFSDDPLLKTALLCHTVPKRQKKNPVPVTVDSEVIIEWVRLLSQTQGDLLLGYSDSIGCRLFEFLFQTDPTSTSDESFHQGARFMLFGYGGKWHIPVGPEDERVAFKDPWLSWLVDSKLTSSKQRDRRLYILDKLQVKEWLHYEALSWPQDDRFHQRLVSGVLYEVEKKNRKEIIAVLTQVILSADKFQDEAMTALIFWLRGNKVYVAPVSESLAKLFSVLPRQTLVNDEFHWAAIYPHVAPEHNDAVLKALQHDSGEPANPEFVLLGLMYKFVYSKWKVPELVEILRYAEHNNLHNAKKFLSRLFSRLLDFRDEAGETQMVKTVDKALGILESQDAEFIEVIENLKVKVKNYDEDQHRVRFSM